MSIKKTFISSIRGYVDAETCIAEFSVTQKTKVCKHTKVEELEPFIEAATGQKRQRYKYTIPNCLNLRVIEPCEELEHDIDLCMDCIMERREELLLAKEKNVKV